MNLAFIVNSVGTKFHFMASRTVASSQAFGGSESGDICRIVSCNTSANSITLSFPVFTSRLQAGSWIILFDSHGNASSNNVSVNPDFLNTNYTLNGSSSPQTVIDSDYGAAILLYRPLSNTELSWFSFKISGSSASGSISNISTVSANTTINSTYHIVIVDSSSSSVTITLPYASQNEGRNFVVKRTGGNSVTLNPKGTDTIDGSSSLSVGNDDDSITVISDGSNWQVLSSYGSSW